MRGRAYVIAVLLMLTAAAGAAVYLGSRPAATVQLSLRVHPVFGEDALRLGQGRYANPGGDGVFDVRDFQFFVSNIRLVAEDAVYREADSYHLARFDSEDGTYVIGLEDVPRADYSHLEFGIGVDSAANASIASVGDLDPNGRMAWGWDAGYKFVLVEGALELDDRRIPLVYHVGFDENYMQGSLAIAAPQFEGGEATLDLCADLLQMFGGSQTVDMSQLSNVKSDGDDARLLAENYGRMVSVCPGRDSGSANPQP
ncbi:MAG: MbnP family protein [Gemmatimonadota bacterium]